MNLCFSTLSFWSFYIHIMFTYQIQYLISSHASCKLLFSLLFNFKPKSFPHDSIGGIYVKFHAKTVTAFILTKPVKNLTIKTSEYQKACKYLDLHSKLFKNYFNFDHIPDLILKFCNQTVTCSLNLFHMKSTGNVINKAADVPLT